MMKILWFVVALQLVAIFTTTTLAWVFYSSERQMTSEFAKATESIIAARISLEKKKDVSNAATEAILDKARCDAVVYFAKNGIKHEDALFIAPYDHESYLRSASLSPEDKVLITSYLEENEN